MSLHVESNAIKRTAAEVGFDACGIARADAIDPENRLRQWLDSGYHADMAWMERTSAIRADPRLKMSEARSIVVVARNYYSQRPERQAGTGRVSRYAWGRDYHRVLLKPLRHLATFIEARAPGAETYSCVDSGPVMEKAWAARAGVGWIGKNSLVLNRDLGSFFFLGVIITTAEIQPDTAVADQCGSCTLCIDACPTEAIVEPRVVDSRRCISYHTIENRGGVPDELAGKFDDWIFGCDVCQDVCPWNRKARDTSEVEFLPRPGHANVELNTASECDEAAFFTSFAGTPIMRAKWQGFRRNARIAFKNLDLSD